MEENSILEEQIETLETEVKKFADGLPYWAKFLAERILSGNAICDNDIDTSHSYLLEHLKLSEEPKSLKLRLTTMLKMQGLINQIYFLQNLKMLKV